MLFVFFSFDCTRENFLPALFDTNNSNLSGIIEKGTLDTTKGEYCIDPGQTHRFNLLIDSGYTYSFYLISESRIFGIIIFKKEGYNDSLILAEMINGSESSLFAANKQLMLYLNIQSNSSLYKRYYTIAYKKRKSSQAVSTSYLDTSITNFTLKPVKAIFSDSLSFDSIQFDHLHRKYRYKIPIDSFEMNVVDFLHYNSLLPLSCVLISQIKDTVVLCDTTPDFSFFSYWDSTKDTLDMILGVVVEKLNNYASILEKYGIVLDPLNKTQVSLRKSKFPPVHEDPFTDDTASMIFLAKDTTYNLSLYKEKYDKFFYTTRPDSIYSLVITSPDSLPLFATLSPMSSDLSELSDIRGKKEIHFKPSLNATVFGIEISSTISFPTNYTLQLRQYTGNDTIDPFEPDDTPEKATLLVQDSVYQHTIFPMNDIDLFKISCKGADTFMIYVDFKDSMLLKNSEFSLYPYFNFDQNALKIHRLSIRDSASYEISTWYRTVADTAFFVARNIQSGDYAISLRRK